MVDVNRGTAGIELTPEQSQEIWSAAEYSSAVMQLATPTYLPGSGISVPIITGEPEAEWVDETAEKPVSRPSFGSKTMTPYTAAVIVPFSNQFRRDKARLYAEIVRKLPQALAKKFDQTVFGPQAGAPGDNFDTLGNAPVTDLGPDVYQGLVAADSSVAVGAEDGTGGVLNGWALSPAARGLLLGSTDNNGRPLFINSVADDAVPRLLGAATAMTRGITAIDGTIGYAGDWTSAHYGVVESIDLSISDQASINDGGTVLHLWQRNMFAVRAEFEVGFRVRDINHFTRLINEGAPADGGTGE